MANSFINKKADLTTTDLTTLYTVPSFKTAVVKSLLVSEDAGSGTTITITLDPRAVVVACRRPGASQKRSVYTSQRFAVTASRQSLA